MKKEYDYISPELVLIIADKKDATFLEQSFQKGLNQLEDKYVALALHIESNSIEKLFPLIKLMDIKGIYLHGKYSKFGHILTDSRSNKPVDSISFEKKKYVGLNCKETISNEKNIAELIAANIKHWTKKTIDIKRLRKNISR